MRSKYQHVKDLIAAAVVHARELAVAKGGIQPTQVGISQVTGTGGFLVIELVWTKKRPRFE